MARTNVLSKCHKADVTIKSYILNFCFFSFLCSRSWQLNSVSHVAIIHRDYWESCKASVSVLRLDLTSEQSGPIGMDKFIRAVKVSTLMLQNSFFYHLPTCSNLLFKSLCPCVKPITDLHCDYQSVGAGHCSSHWAPSYRSLFFSQQGAGGEERGIRF